MNVVLVAGVAFALRVAWVLAVPTKPVGDFAMYLESAAHLVEHGALDQEFVYMPGYVALVALVRAAGGGLVAIKLVGAVLGALGAAAVHEIGAALWDRRAGLVAGLGWALWPAGVAAASVTGTDMPAAALIAIAVAALVRLGPRRPLAAALAFGAAMGLAAWVRAVAVPLAAFAIVYFRAAGAPWRTSAVRAAAALGIALCVLSPWAARNHARYGEWFLTDSHGGLTALVGANPNSDGRYSRSLNRVFKEVTGYTLLGEPHRQADRASYALARELTAFSPGYALGLVGTKAERLLAHQHALLYWPIYRVGVLREGPQKAWFDRHRAALETAVDVWWAALAVSFFLGVGIAAARRRWTVLAFLPLQLALCGMYALYFAEVRYQLAVVGLMFPVAAGGVIWLRELAGHLARERRLPGSRLRELATAAGAVVVLVAGWPALVWAGARLREHHRFAAHVCHAGGEARLCRWAARGGGDSPVRGVWDGVGVRLRAEAGAAYTAIDLPSGRHHLSARIDLAPLPTGPLGEGRVALVTGAGAPLASVGLADLVAASARGEALPLAATFAHAGGAFGLRLELPGVAAFGSTSVWLSGLAFSPAPAGE